MDPAAAQTHEIDRLNALHSAEILDTANEEGFDAIVELAAYVCRTPISAVTFIDANRQWFKASVGLTERESPKDISFCAHAVAADRVLIVADARLDARFSNYPNVTGTSNIRFYAGIPLHDHDGFALGTLCVVDREPRLLDDQQERALKALATQAETQLRLRKIASDLRDALREVKTLGGLVPMCAWCRKVRNDKAFWQDVETYLKQQANVLVSHGICPDCLAKM